MPLIPYAILSFLCAIKVDLFFPCRVRRRALSVPSGWDRLLSVLVGVPDRELRYDRCRPPPFHERC